MQRDKSPIIGSSDEHDTSLTVVPRPPREHEDFCDATKAHYGPDDYETPCWREQTVSESGAEEATWD